MNNAVSIRCLIAILLLRRDPKVSARRIVPSRASIDICELLHVHFHAHPGMNAALEQVLALRQSRDIEVAALKNPGAGHSYVLEATLALRDNTGRAAGIERRQESVAVRFHLGKGVRLTALVDYRKDCSRLDRHLVGFEVPTWIGRAVLGAVEEIAQGGRKAKGGKRNVVTKAAAAFAKRSVKRRRIAFVQRHDLSQGFRVRLRPRMSREGERCSCRQNYGGRDRTHLMIPPMAPRFDCKRPSTMKA